MIYHKVSTKSKLSFDQTIKQNIFRCKKFSVNFGDFIFPHDLMYIDDGDNNSNNGDDGDDDEYNSNNPETHEDHHHSSSGDSIRSSARSFLIFSAIVLTTKKFLNSFWFRFYFPFVWCRIAFLSENWILRNFFFV